MEDKCEGDSKVDDVMLPGFRFHPTDEELVGFYLRRKIQGRALPIELIKQVDIYKYDPWDLPKFATTGEKEWYFYCPRDRKYRNSARPNRVTGAGFWKATGTDRPIYSSEGTKCIGLKKSLVFYRGRAAKGIKTDWMMHEFRLPSVAPDLNQPNKKFLDRNIPPNDSWAICRIFKKPNSMAQQRALSHHWLQQFPEPVGSDLLGLGAHCTARFSSENISCTTDIGSAIQLGSGSSDNLQNSNTYFSTMDVHSNVPNVCKSSGLPVSNGQVLNSFTLSPVGVPEPTGCSVDTSSLILGPALLSDVSKASESIDFQGPQQFMCGFSIGLASDLQASMGTGVGEVQTGTRKNSVEAHVSSQWMTPPHSMGFPFSLPSNMPWDSPQCPSDISTGFSTNKCYT